MAGRWLARGEIECAMRGIVAAGASEVETYKDRYVAYDYTIVRVDCLATRLVLYCARRPANALD